MGKSGGRKKKGEFYNYIIILPHKKIKEKKTFWPFAIDSTFSI